MVPHFTYLSYRILLFILFVVEALEYCFWNGILRLQILLKIMMLLDPTTWLIPKKGWELSISVSLSLPFSSVRPNSQPSNSTQKLPKAPPPLAASASSDPVSTPSLKQITPWPTSWFRTTLACACASQNYASVFARRFRGISSVRLATEKYCWQYKIPHINNKRTENWRFFCLLYVTSVCLNMLRQSFKVSVASWPSIKRFFCNHNYFNLLLFCGASSDKYVICN